jgi:hypothetical protein
MSVDISWFAAQQTTVSRRRQAAFPDETGRRFFAPNKSNQDLQSRRVVTSLCVPFLGKTNWQAAAQLLSQAGPKEKDLWQFESE